MLDDLFDFTKRKNWKQALFFYVMTLLMTVIILGVVTTCRAAV